MDGDGEYLSLDSEKGEWLLDLAMYQRWQASAHGDTSNRRFSLTPQQQELAQEACQLYQSLVSMAQTLTPELRTRLYQYLEGESLDRVGQCQSTPITRQAVHKSLSGALSYLSLTLAQARGVWEYGHLHELVAT